MQSLKNIFLKSVSALALLFFAGTAQVYAQGTATGNYWVCEAGVVCAEADAITLIDVTTRPDYVEGQDYDFQLDVRYQNNAAISVDSANFEMHMIVEKLEVLNHYDNRFAGTSTPGRISEGDPVTATQPVTQSATYAEYQTLQGGPAYGTGANSPHPDTTGLIFSGWTHNNSSWAPAGENLFLAGLNMRWKAGATGATPVVFTQNPSNGAFDQTDGPVWNNFTVQGTLPAQLSVDPPRLLTAGSPTATTVTLTCTLAGNAPSGSDAECGYSIGGTAVVTTDYTITPADTAGTFDIADGSKTGTMDFTITPVADATGTIVFSSSGITGGVTIAGTDVGTATVTLVAADVAVSKNTVSTGGNNSSDDFTVVLTSQPDANVNVTIVSEDLTAATVTPGSLVFTGNADASTTCTYDPADAANNVTTGGNWCIPQSVTVNGRGTMGGDYMIKVTGTSTSAGYENVVKLITGTNGVAKFGTLSNVQVTESPPGVKNFSVVATIEGSIRATQDCSVTLTGAPGVPAGNTSLVAAELFVAGMPDADPVVPDMGDYSALVLDTTTGADAMILMGMNSVTLAGSVMTHVDTDSDVESILISGMGSDCGGGEVEFGFAASDDGSRGGLLTMIDSTAGDVAAMLNTTVAPVVLQQTIAHGLSSIAARVDAPIVNTTQFSLNGKSTIEGAVADHMSAMSLAQEAGEDPTQVEYDWKNALANSSILMPLNGGGAAFWVNGDYRSLDVDTGGTTADGDTLTISLGADTQISPSMLVGLMLSTYDSEVDYTQMLNDSPRTGKYTISGNSIRPYFGWSAGALSVWGNVGFGEGEMEVDDSELGMSTNDTSELSLAVGVKQQLVEGLAVKADVALATIEIDALEVGGTPMTQEVDSQRTRLLLEGRNSYNRANGSIEPNVEIGIRHDLVEDNAGSGENSSTGAEAAAGVDFANRATGVTLSTKVRFYSGSDYDEWGISGTISKKAAAQGLGLAFNMTPTHGDVTSGVQNLFDTSFSDTMSSDAEATADADYATRFNTGMSYGFRAPGARGVMMPYSEAKFGDSIDGQHKLGLKWTPSTRFNVDVHGGQDSANSVYGLGFTWKRPVVDLNLAAKSAETDTNVVDNKVTLTGTIDF